MSLAHDSASHRSPPTRPLGRRGRIRWTAWKDRWLAAGRGAFDSPLAEQLAAEAMIAAARAAFAHLEIRRSKAGLLYSPMAGWLERDDHRPASKS